MDGDERTAVEVIAGGVTNLPASVETSLLKAIGQLLGGVAAIPAAWLKRPAQAVDDLTVARSTASAILAKGAAEKALQDPAVLEAAVEIYLPTIVRKARNRAQIAQQAAERTAEKATDAEAGRSAPPDEDWMGAFMRFAEDASSEKLQDLFARILAGEVVRPGSFSLATLRAVSELDKSVAEDFSLMWTKCVGGAVDHSRDFDRGEWFSRWKRLAEVGLMAHTSTTQFLPAFHPAVHGSAIWSPMSAGAVRLMVHFSQNCSANWPHIEFTRVGRQIGSLLAIPDYVANISAAALRFVGQPDIQRIDLFVPGQAIEIWRKPS